MPDPAINPVRLQQLLDLALQQPEAERVAYVQKVAAHDPALRDAALAQIAHHSKPGDKRRFFSRDHGAASSADDALPPELQALRAGQRIGDFTLVRFLGKGGMGQVWEARQESLKKSVALKLLLPGRIDERAMELFVREARAGGKCHHNNLVATLARGEDDGIAWLAQELVADAQTLDDALARFRDLDKLPDGYHAQVAALVAKVADGMQAAHDAGVVHRDLKPQNILIGADDEPRVADFGLARVGGDSFASKTGDFAGTYFYMSPEQVAAKRIGMDHRTDVFSLGVVLYELLTLQRPFVGDTGQQIAQQIAQWDPPRADLVRSQCPRDLGVIAEKAMQKAAAQRYPTMAALAADLRRHLEHLPILARPTGRIERSKKWVRRNPTVSAVMATVVVGAVVAGTLAWQNTKLAQEKSALATAEASAKKVAQDKVDQFHQLSAVVRLKAVVDAQDALWLSETDRDGWPAKIPALKAWLEGPCAQLLAQRPAIEATVADLRSRALPLTEEQIEADRRASPSHAAWQRQLQIVASLRRAQSIRDGKEALVLPELPAALRDADAKALNTFAWPRVAPEAKEGAKVQRTIFGEEALALVAARAAVAKSVDAADGYTYLDTLAWALLSNGQDAEAKQRTAEALGKAPQSQRESYEGYRREIESAIAESAARLSAAETQLAQLDAEVSRRRTWTFGTDPDGESARFLHDALVGALTGMDGLSRQQKADVELRLRWAESVGDLSRAHPRARHTWAAVRDAIAKADDVAASKLYAGKSITIPDAGWPGLVPIGMNPATKLWEFYDLRSAWDGSSDPAQIAIPEHKEDGAIEVTAATGIVFVLLPGGTFWMGSQKEDPNGPNFDPQSRNDETLHEVTLSPYLLARHELTRPQWSRLWTWDPELRDPSSYKSGETIVGKRITGANPVEQVDWSMCDLLLTRHGLSLPTEAQWEHGCRGGTQTVWQVSLKELRQVANVASADAKAAGAGWTCETWRDGHVVHARVGSFGANAYGLYDMHGNVWEWCRDWYGDYGSERGGDGLRSVDSPSYRCNRGGGFNDPAALARSANRIDVAPYFRSHNLGLRPARIITW